MRQSQLRVGKDGRGMESRADSESISKGLVAEGALVVGRDLGASSEMPCWTRRR